MTKKYIKRAEVDMGLIFTTYNLRRIMNIIGTDVLKEYVKNYIHLCISTLLAVRIKLNLFKQIYSCNNFRKLKQKQSLKIAYI